MAARDGKYKEPAPGFSAYRAGLIHSWLVILTGLGFTLVPLFIVLDYFTMPAELLTRFAEYRIGATVIVLAQAVVVRRTKASELSYLHGYFFSLVVGGMIVWMTVDLGGFDSSYYAGLNLVIVAVNLLLPWRAVHSAVNGLLVITMYVVANLIWGHPFEVPNLVNNLYFMGSTVVIAVAINFTKHRLIEREYTLRAELEETNHSLDRSRLELKSARDALWSEMAVAKRIQTALVPPNRRLGKYDALGLMLPAEEVGGDYYDFIETPAGERWVAIGDVSGHGVESGLVMMMSQTALLSTALQRRGLTPSELFSSINGAIRENMARLGATRFMTLNVIRLEDDALVVSGKHQDLLVWRKAAQAVETIANDGCWLGLVADVAPHVQDLRIPVGPGDLVCLFTDGVTEATSATGELFGEARIVEVLQRTADQPLGEVLSALVAAVQKFQSSQLDDITIVLLRRDA